MSLVPHEWENDAVGEGDPDEAWKLGVEHDMMKDGHPFVVTIHGWQEDDEDGRTDFCLMLSPGKAREVATALLVYAHLAEQENRRRGASVCQRCNGTGRARDTSFAAVDPEFGYDACPLCAAP